MHENTNNKLKINKKIKKMKITVDQLGSILNLLL